MGKPGCFMTALALLAVLVGPIVGVVSAQSLSGPGLREALRSGGLVIVMRHASSPRERPDMAAANPDNPGRERQLDQAGRETAAAMGTALRLLGIRVGATYSSPAYRALETARLAGLGSVEPVGELDVPGGMGADPSTLGPQAAWLRARVAQAPPAGTHVFVITHAPNVSAAFPQDAAGLADGEALVFRPGGAQPGLIARVRIEHWPDLVK